MLGVCVCVWAGVIPFPSVVVVGLPFSAGSWGFISGCTWRFSVNQCPSSSTGMEVLQLETAGFWRGDRVLYI